MIKTLKTKRKIDLPDWVTEQTGRCGSGAESMSEEKLKNRKYTCKKSSVNAIGGPTFVKGESYESKCGLIKTERQSYIQEEEYKGWDLELVEYEIEYTFSYDRCENKDGRIIIQMGEITAHAKTEIEAKGFIEEQYPDFNLKLTSINGESVEAYNE